MEKRNAEIAERFTTMSEMQPLATANKIISYLANEYGMTPQGIGVILRKMGIETATQQPYTLKTEQQ